MTQTRLRGTAAALATSAIAFLGGVGAGAWAQADLFRGDCRGGTAETWQIRIVGEDEPGEAMVVTGTVYAADGETPVPGVTVFVFQTDARGYYSEGGMNESNARICGLMLTDERGRYRFETVRPASYATGGVAAHVHYRVWGPGIERQGFLLQFAGDPLLGARGRDAEANPPWATVRPVTRGEDGTLHVRRDLRLH